MTKNLDPRMRYHTIIRTNNKGADQTAQQRSLIFVLIVRLQQNLFLSLSRRGC